MSVRKLQELKLHRRQSFYRDEDGAMIILSLFLFVILLFVAGISVDVMLNERERVRAQTTLDTAVISASAINQERDPELVVRDYMMRAGFDPSEVNIAPVVQNTNGSDVTGRSVSAGFNIETNTIFMSMLGIDLLNSSAGARAEEGTSELEIALVLDVSLSMGDDSKLDQLKDAAKEFVTSVLANNDPKLVSISIVPYNHQVYMTDVMVSTIPRRADADQTSRCAFFRFNNNFRQRSILPNANGIFTSAVFTNDLNYLYEREGVTNTAFEEPEEWSKWCNDFAPKVMLYSNNETLLHDHIDSLEALEGTAIDYGMKWGVAVLDPSMQPTISAMVASGERTSDAIGHPFDYGQDDVLKFVVLMSDGRNDKQYNLKTVFQSDQSRIWHSASLAAAAGDDFHGFLVEMPDALPSERWYVPGDPADLTDDYDLAEADFPADAQQQSYRDLYRRFTVLDLAEYFFIQRDSLAYNEHAEAVARTSGTGAMNTRTRLACDAAKENDRITVFAVSFDAPQNGQSLLQDCASTPGHYFDADAFGNGTTVADAFATIAAQLAVLRIVN